MSSLFASTRYPSALDAWVRAGAIEDRDLRAVASLFSLAGETREADPLAWIAMALVLATPRSGHTCVDLSRIAMWAPTEPSEGTESWPADTAAWVSAVAACGRLVCAPEDVDTSPRKPFVLHIDPQGRFARLYAARSFHEERRVAAQLATALAEGRLTIVTGGPGSGKTTKVAAELVRRVTEGSGEHSVALAAPTGLAAKRMARAIRAAVRRAEPEPGPDTVRAIEALPKLTVHKLLRFNPVARVQWRHNAQNHMPYEAIIIDEVSMMPLSMMARVLDAMRPGSHLTLVGDPNQLASVDAGTVLADIVLASDLDGGFVRPEEGSYRFPAGSPVGDIAARTKMGDLDGVLAAISTHSVPVAEGAPRFAWVDPAADEPALNAVALSVVEHARRLCEMASAATGPDDWRAIIEFRDGMQVVCAHRRGNLGVSGWNRAVERHLGPLASGQWYIGRPVMVTRNDSLSGLSNGDIGVVCADGTGGRVVVFGDAEEVHALPVSKVPQVETVHALTIHKSQGSEYGHTIVVLPRRPSRILTRELLYTGMTRAKPHLTLVATSEVLAQAVTTPVQRATGLADRLVEARAGLSG